MEKTSSEKRRAVVDPSGTWEYSDLLGAICKIRSTGIGWNDVLGTDSETTYTISDIKFRINSDGEAVSVAEVSGKEYLLEDLEIISL